MDYSELVSAIQNGNQRKANKMCAEAAPILKKYLISKVGAEPDDADEALQNMFEYVINKIRDEEIDNPAGLLAYMLKSSKHSYYNMLRGRRRDFTEEIQEEPVSPAEQVLRLVDKEKQKILRICIEKLKKGYREFITHWFSFPDAETEDIAEHFDISVNNAWTRKHRIVKKLTDCVNGY